MDRVKIRFYMDPETGEPHIRNHGSSRMRWKRFFGVDWDKTG
jgi:hypothetical protein